MIPGGRAMMWGHFRRSGGGGVVPLLPAHKIMLLASHGGGERFAGLFRSVWAKMPLWGRRKILGHWRDERQAAGLFIIGAPAVSLLDGPIHLDDRPCERVLGMVDRRGFRIQFRGDRAAEMPDDVAMDLIAHELAHVYQWAAGWEEMTSGDHFVIEEGADVMTAAWGFGITSVDEWVLAAGRVGVVDASSWTTAQKDEHNARVLRSGRGVLIP